MMYTKGPWEVEVTDEGHEIRMGNAIQDPHNHEVQLLVNYDHGLYKSDGMQYVEAEANANLIAAAPDMLEALEEIKRSLVMVGGITGTAMSHGEQIDLGLLSSELGRLFTVAINAIDKAKGEGA